MPVRFSLDADNLLPGLLAATRTRIASTGDEELPVRSSSSTGSLLILRFAPHEGRARRVKPRDHPWCMCGGRFGCNADLGCVGWAVRGVDRWALGRASPCRASAGLRRPSDCRLCASNMEDIRRNSLAEAPRRSGHRPVDDNCGLLADGHSGASSKAQDHESQVTIGVICAKEGGSRRVRP